MGIKKKLKWQSLAVSSLYTMSNKFMELFCVNFRQYVLKITGCHCLTKAALGLVFVAIFFVSSPHVFAYGLPVVLGDGVDASSTVIGPGYQATTSDSFTFRVATTSTQIDATSSITQVTVDLNGGGANDGLRWVSALSSSNNNWGAVAFGAGTFVAISASSTSSSVMYSTSTDYWVQATATTTNGWTAITYGKGMFVVVASTSSLYPVMTSSTGASWVSRSAPTNTWKSVVYGNGMYVAVAATSSTSNVMTSYDGANWTLRTGSASNNWNSVTYGNGLFVAVASSGTGDRVMTSPDGITWTSRTSAADNTWNSVTYGNGLFVAVASSGTGDRVMTSPDGITWTSRTSAADNTWNSVTYGNGLFVAVASSGTGNRVMVSQNGTSWATRPSVFDNNWNGVVYGNGLIVAVASSGTNNRVMYSSTGASASAGSYNSTGHTWSTSLPTFARSWSSVTYGNGVFVAVSLDSYIATSYDGVTWSESASPLVTGNIFLSATYANGLFLVSSLYPLPFGSYFYSYDGKTWATTTASGVGGTSITYGSSTFVSVIGTSIGTSYDGTTWTSRTPARSINWKGVTHGNGTFVAVSDDVSTTTNVMTSTNGITWVAINSGVRSNWSSVTYGNDVFVAVAASTTGVSLMISTTTTQWSALTGVASTSWNHVTFLNGLFIAVGSSVNSGDSVMVSRDGYTWSTTTGAINGSNWSSIAYGGGALVAVSTNGSIMTSRSGSSYNYSEYYKSIALVEVTSNDGATVYGSVSEPVSDKIVVPIVNAPLHVSSTTSQYKIRITPRSHQAIAVAPGEYYIRSRISSFSNTTGESIGEDAAGATTTIDNFSESVGGDGYTWNEQVVPGDAVSLRSVTYANGLFVVNALGGAATSSRILTSPDGATWTPRNIEPSGWRMMAYGGGLYVVTACSENTSCGRSSTVPRIATSPDGITWTTRTSASSTQSWYGVAYGNGVFVVSSYDGGGIMTSVDGITWKLNKTLFPSTSSVNISYGNGIFLASAGNSGLILTSPDGITWTQRQVKNGGYFYGNRFANGRFLVGDTSGKVFSSLDGVTWDYLLSNLPGQVYSFAYGNNRHILSMYSGSTSTYISFDGGGSWGQATTSSSIVSSGNWQGTAYGQGVFVSVGDSRIITSSLPAPAISNNKITLPFTTTLDSDLERILVLQNTLPITDKPTDGLTYATGTIIGSSKVSCSFPVTPSTRYTCDATNVYNGTPYYFKVFTKDVFGNYSEGSVWAPASSTPNRTITIGQGSDELSKMVPPGSSATSSNSFTLQTDSGIDSIQSVTVTFASSTATSTSLVEITSLDGLTVHGSLSMPSTDVVVIPVNGLLAKSVITEYRVRVTSKSHILMPAPEVGINYFASTTVTNVLGTNVIVIYGSDYASTTITIDNGSPGNVANWKYQVPAVSLSWRSVTYGNGLFVAVSFSGTSNRVMTSPDGIVWTSRTSVSDVNWQSVVFGNNLFVAVAATTTTSNVMTSSDGITWTLRTGAFAAAFRSITYGNGLFVAVACSSTGISCTIGGTSNRIMTSPDGVTWTTRTGSRRRFQSVTFGNGLFVAVADTVGSLDRALVSSNGTTWSTSIVAADNDWKSVTYGNGLFVAVASSGTGNRVMTSPDGVSWTSRTSAVDSAWNSVTYGNGLFVAVASSGTGDRVMTSPNGIVWTSQAGAINNPWTSIVHANGTFVAVSSTNSSSSVMISSFPFVTPANSQLTLSFVNSADSDISTTTILRSTSPITETLVEGVSYATSSAVGASTVVCSFTVIATSTRTCTNTGLVNGTPYYFKLFTQDTNGNWSIGLDIGPVAPGVVGVTLGVGTDTPSVTLPPGGTATTVDTFTLQTTSGTDDIPSLTLTFASGTAQALSLVEITNNAGSTVYGSVANPSSDVVPITLNTNTLTSNTALTQYRVRITPKSHVNMPAVPGDTYEVMAYVSSFRATNGYTSGSDLGGATTTVVRVDNESPSDVNRIGINWRATSIGISAAWNAITYGNGLFVAVSNTSTGATSPDGITWTVRNTVSALRSVVYGNGLFVGVGSATVVTSPDGITWTTRSVPNSNTWSSVTYGNGLFVAVSDELITSNVMISSDGITWVNQVGSAPSFWDVVTFGEGKFVAVGGFAAMSSSDGVAWRTSITTINSSLSSVAYGKGIFVAVSDTASGNIVMTSTDGLTWTSRASAADNSWTSVTYGNGLFVAVSNTGTGNRVMISPDGITWTSRTSAADLSWYRVTYGNGTFVATPSGAGTTSVMLSVSVVASSSNSQLTLSFVNSADSDISTTTILRSTSPITETLVEGVSYATSSAVGASTVVCSFTVIATSTRTCTNTGLVNGTPYYFKLFTQDTNGNWSIGLDIGPVAPGVVGVTLGVGTDTPSVTLPPGGTATTVDTFTLQTTSGTDDIPSLTLTFASGTAQALSLVEITNNAGSTVYGSVANPSSDVVPITLNTNTLTSNTALTQYRVRITPKSHVNMPAVPGDTYEVMAYVSSFRATNGYTSGSDLGGATTTVVRVDNESPVNPISLSAVSDSFRQVILRYIVLPNAGTSSIVVLRAVTPVTDVPTEGAVYEVGNTVGSSVVVCVDNTVMLGARNICLDSFITRSTAYYYKIFAKDSSGNYSTGLQSGPHRVVSPRSVMVGYIEAESLNGGTTTRTGFTSFGADHAGTGTTTSATTTATTTPSRGGGAGDSGNLYVPSNLAEERNTTKSTRNPLARLFESIVVRSAPSAHASVKNEEPSCKIKIFNTVCVAKNVPWAQ